MDYLNNSDEDYSRINFTNGDNSPAYAAVASVIMILGTLANLFIVIFILTRRKTLQEPSTFLLGLSISHLISCCFYLPFPIVTAVAGEWVFGNTQAEKEIWCGMCSFLLTFTVVNNPIVTNLIFVDRLFASYCPLHIYVSTPKRTTFLLLLAFFFSLLYCAVYQATTRLNFSPVIFSCISSYVTPEIEIKVCGMVALSVVGLGIVLPFAFFCDLSSIRFFIPSIKSISIIMKVECMTGLVLSCYIVTAIFFPFLLISNIPTIATLLLTLNSRTDENRIIHEILLSSLFLSTISIYVLMSPILNSCYRQGAIRRLFCIFRGTRVHAVV